MKSKRTGQDVIKELHALIQLAQLHPAWVETAAHGMTPEQLRRAHEGLSVLLHCIGELPAPACATAATASPAATTSTPKAGNKPRHEPATESG